MQVVMFGLSLVIKLSIRHPKKEKKNERRSQILNGINFPKNQNAGATNLSTSTQPPIFYPLL